MNFQGRAAGAKRDLETGKLYICFECEWNPDVASQYNDIVNVPLDISASRHRKKRSLDANRYAWELMTLIASDVGSSKEEVYEEMLLRYGQFQLNEDGDAVCIHVPHGVDVGVLPGHWMKIRECGNSDQYAMIKGTSEYDTKEMSIFIDGVVSEAKELGIETLPPDEIERMKGEWKDG
jgi:hypothetical protein